MARQQVGLDGAGPAQLAAERAVRAGLLAQARVLQQHLEMPGEAPQLAPLVGAEPRAAEAPAQQQAVAQGALHRQQPRHAAALERAAVGRAQVQVLDRGEAAALGQGRGEVGLGRRAGGAARGGHGPRAAAGQLERHAAVEVERPGQRLAGRRQRARGRALAQRRAGVEALGGRGLVGHEAASERAQRPAGRPRHGGDQRGKSERRAGEAGAEIVPPGADQPLARAVDGQAQHGQRHEEDAGPQCDAELEDAVHHGGPGERRRHQQREQHGRPLARHGAGGGEVAQGDQGREGQCPEHGAAQRDAQAPPGVGRAGPPVGAGEEQQRGQQAEREPQARRSPGSAAARTAPERRGRARRA